MAANSIDDSDGDMHYPSSGDESAFGGDDHRASQQSGSASALGGGLRAPQASQSLIGSAVEADPQVQHESVESAVEVIMSCSNGSIVICPITLTENPDRDPGVVDATNLQVISKTKARAKTWIAAEITSTMPIQEWLISC